MRALRPSRSRNEGLVGPARLGAQPERAVGPRRPVGLTIRWGTPADSAALRRLAELDERSVPEGSVLLAEVEGELWAAVSVSEAGEAADPFRPSGELVLLLHQCAAQIRRSAKKRRFGRGAHSTGLPGPWSALANAPLAALARADDQPW